MTTATRQTDLLRSAVRVSATSAAWTVIASAAAIAVGLTDDSVALVAFGFVGLLDCAASVALVAHFRDARSGGTAEHLERLALRVVTAGLVTVGVATAVVSVLRLVDGSDTHGSTAAVVLAGASLLALSALSLRKRHVSTRLPSHALLADAHLSAVGAGLAGVTLVGTAMARSLGWWWADPAAALAVGVAAFGIAVAIRREPR